MFIVSVERMSPPWPDGQRGETVAAVQLWEVKLHEQTAGIQYKKWWSECVEVRCWARERKNFFWSPSFPHTATTSTSIYSPPLAVIWLQSLSPPPPPTPTHTHVISTHLPLLHSAPVIFTLSLFWSTGWHWWISLSCTGLGKKKFARRFSRPKTV